MPTADKPVTPNVDRHRGDPITTLDDVRDRHNVVAAVSDIGAARRLIRELEAADIEPSTVSLLGAWPQQDTPPPPRLLSPDALKAAGWGAVATMAAFSLVARKWRRRITLVGGLLTGLATAMAAATGAPGSSAAWRQTLAADGEGTVAVGVHSKNAIDTLAGEQVMRRHGALSVNRF
jgi:hypothetical protein